MASLTIACNGGLGGAVGQELAGAAALRARSGVPVETDADSAGVVGGAAAVVAPVMVMAAAVAVVVVELAVVVGEAAAAVAAAAVVTVAAVVVAVMEERARTDWENEVAAELAVTVTAAAAAVSKGQLGPQSCPGSRSTLCIRMPRPPRKTLLECQCRRRGDDPQTRGWGTRPGPLLHLAPPPHSKATDTRGRHDSSESAGSSLGSRQACNGHSGGSRADYKGRTAATR
jgi:hypothetical protein